MTARLLLAAGFAYFCWGKRRAAELRATLQKELYSVYDLGLFTALPAHGMVMRLRPPRVTTGRLISPCNATDRK